MITVSIVCGTKRTIESVVKYGDGVEISLLSSHNEALKSAKGEYFAVITGDVEFFEDWATPMLSALRDSESGQACLRVAQGNYVGLDCVPTFKILKNAEYAESSCFMMRTDLARKYGLFDESYYHQDFRDIDLSFRLRADGYMIWPVSVKWTHMGRRVTGAGDLVGQRVIDERKFRKRWNSYLIAGDWQKDFVVVKCIGDMSSTFRCGPELARMKKDFNCILGVMSKYPETLEHAPYVDCMIEYNAPVQCSRVFEMESEDMPDLENHLFISDEEHRFVEKLISKLKAGYITLDLSTARKGVQWPLLYYTNICVQLQAKGHKVIAIGYDNEGPPDLPADINLVNKLPHVLHCAVVMSHAKMHIGHDGLFSHFARSLGMPHLILYGATEPKEAEHSIITPLACKSCQQDDAIVCRRRGEEHACMKTITPEMVMELIKEKL